MLVWRQSYYDEDKGQCVELHGGRQSVSYVEVNPGVCPFKPGRV